MLGPQAVFHWLAPGEKRFLGRIGPGHFLRGGTIKGNQPSRNDSDAMVFAALTSSQRTKRYRLDFWVLHSLFASHFSGSAATTAQQNAKAARDFRETLVTLVRRGPTLRTASCRVISETFAFFAEN